MVCVSIEPLKDLMHLEIAMVHDVSVTDKPQI